MKKVIIFLAVFLFANPLRLLNEYRNAVGLNSLEENPSLTLAAKWHAKYIIKNNEFTHYERKYGIFYSGKTPADRAVSSGYKSRFVIENISQGEKNYNESVKDLFSAIYHRLGFLNFNINEIGFYNLKDVFVYDMGNKFINQSCDDLQSFDSGFKNICKDIDKILPKDVFFYQMKNNPKIVFWPYNNMKNVPTVFYEEMPDPLPNYGVSGYPISISFNPFYFKNEKITLLTFELYKNGKKIEKTKIITNKNDINHIIKKTEFVLFPLERLDYGSRYKVEADFIIDGKIKYFEWNFNTEEKKVPIITVSKYKGRYFIKPNITYLIYFKPLSKNDKLSDIKFEYQRGIAINKMSYKDLNTLVINISGTKGKIIKIKSKKREIELIIKD